VLKNTGRERERALKIILVRAATAAALFGLLVSSQGCGGGAGAGGGSGGGPVTYAIGATFSGLVGSRLVLSNNGNTVSVAPAFNGQLPKLFANLQNGASYDITVTTQPTTPAQTCVVANGQGTIASANVTDISVTCTTTPARFLLGEGVLGGAACVTASAIDSTTGALTSTGAPPLCTVYIKVPIVPDGPMAVEPQGKFLYVANPGGQLGGFLDTLGIDRGSGAVTYLQSQEVVGIGEVAVDPSGKFLFVSGPGGLGAWTIDPASGAVTFPSVGGYQFPDGSPSAVSVDPLGRFFYALFGSDKVVALSFDSTTGALSQIAPPVAVDGHSWVVPHPSGRFLYVGINPYSGIAAAIAAFNADPTNGTLTPVAGSPFAAGNGSTSAAAVDPSGNYLYVANNVSNDISAYTIDQSSGQLTPISGSPFPTRQAPTSVVIEPLGHFLYVSSGDTITAATGVSAYEIGTTGALTEISGSPFTSALGTYAVLSY
jgi:6-phosphogluconolactonase